MTEYICNQCGISFKADPASNGIVRCTACNAVLNANELSVPLPPGTRVGGYELIRHLATGGTGSVYVAEQLTMERKVALKILHNDLLQENDIRRFLEEAVTTAKFQHPGIITVIDAGQSPEGYYFLAMQYAEGVPIDTLLQRGRIFAEDEALMIIIQVAEALQCIWDKFQILHKDIKPGNMMLGPENKTMLLDLGIAQEYGASVLDDGDIQGSPHYMSPEQARGETLDWSSDLYSLGATLYHMLTGVVPYERQTAEEILLAHNNAPFPEPEKRAPNVYVSEQMCNLLRRMMAKTPSERFSSWGEFITTSKALLVEFWKLNGNAAVTGKQKQDFLAHHQEQISSGTKKEKILTSRNFYVYVTGIILLLAALAGSLIMYCAARKNTANAQACLEPIRKLLSEKEPDVGKLEEYFKLTEKYFHRFGVLPSVRSEFAGNKEKVKVFKDLQQKEKLSLSSLETFVSARNKEAAAHIAKASALYKEKDFKKALQKLNQAQTALSQTYPKFKKTKFALHANREKSDALRKTVRKSQGKLSALRRQIMVTAKEQSAVKTKIAAEPGKNTEQLITPAEKERRRKEKIKSLQQNFRKQITAEQNRIRLTLLTLPATERFAEDELLSGATLLNRKEPELAMLQQNFRFWLNNMKWIRSKAATLWTAFYDSHRKYENYQINVGKKVMKIGTILRDTIVLYSGAEPNVKLTFRKMNRNEWHKFIKYVAEKEGMKDCIPGFFLLTADFAAVRETGSADPQVQKELAAIEQTYFRFLTGVKFKGIDTKPQLNPEQILERYGKDPSFTPYRNRIGKSK
ncbi:MAG: protein kinase [Lentisphaeria bacterium]|nr:protein kinase [Lentisphaeria bacterium]